MFRCWTLKRCYSGFVGNQNIGCSNRPGIWWALKIVQNNWSNLYLQKKRKMNNVNPKKLDIGLLWIPALTGQNVTRMRTASNLLVSHQLKTVLKYYQNLWWTTGEPNFYQGQCYFRLVGLGSRSVGLGQDKVQVCRVYWVGWVGAQGQAWAHSNQ